MEQLAPITRNCRHAIARIALGFFGFFAAAILGQIGLILLFEAIAPTVVEGTLFTWLASLLPMYLLGLPLLWLAVRRLPRATVAVRRLRPLDFFKLFAIAFALMYLSNLLGTLINLLTELILGGASQAGATELIGESSLLLTIPLAVILAPIVEEVVFRKILLLRLLPFGEGFAVLTSAILFGLFHGNLAQLPYAFAVGLVLGLVAARTGRLIYPILLHVLLNFLGTVPPTLFLSLAEKFEAFDPAAEMPPTLILSLLLSLLIMLFYLGVVFALVGLGIYFFARHRRALMPHPASEQIPKGERWQILVSPPVLLYALAIVFLFVLSYL